MWQGRGTLRSWDARRHGALLLTGLHGRPADLRSRSGSESRRPGSADTSQSCRGGAGLRLRCLSIGQLPTCNLFGIQLGSEACKWDNGCWFLDPERRRETRAGADGRTRAELHFGATRIRPDLPPVIHPSVND